MIYTAQNYESPRPVRRALAPKQSCIAATTADFPVQKSITKVIKS